VGLPVKLRNLSTMHAIPEHFCSEVPSLNGDAISSAWPLSFYRGSKNTRQKELVRMKVRTIKQRWWRLAIWVQHCGTCCFICRRSISLCCSLQITWQPWRNLNQCTQTNRINSARHDKLVTSIAKVKLFLSSPVLKYNTCTNAECLYIYLQSMQASWLTQYKFSPVCITNKNGYEEVPANCTRSLAYRKESMRLLRSNYGKVDHLSKFLSIIILPTGKCISKLLNKSKMTILKIFIR